MYIRCGIDELPKAAQFGALAEAVTAVATNQHGGNWYLTSVEEGHLLRWIITTSTRGMPPTCPQVRRMATVVRRVSRGAAVPVQDDSKLPLLSSEADMESEAAAPAITQTTPPPTICDEPDSEAQYHWFASFLARHKKELDYLTLKSKSRYQAEDALTIRK